MNRPGGGDLEDLFPEDDLRSTAELLSRAAPLDVQADPAFRSQLRRSLMQEAWILAERRPPFWRRVFAGPRLAWSGAAVGAALIAVVAVSIATTRPGRIETVTFGSPIADARQVSLVEPIELDFSAAMDQQSVERSITISPATQVTFQWTSPTTVKITPVAGDLAPNTQYQVRIASSATTVTHQVIARPQTITFTTAPAPVPSPAPAPTPLPAPRVTMEKQLLPLPAGTPWYQWSPDRATLYLLSQGGAILSMPAAGGSTSTLVGGGATLPALSADGSQLLFLKDGKLQQVTTRDAKLADVAAPDGTVVATGWQGARPVWVSADGSVLAGTPTVKVASLPAGSLSISIAPTGDRVAYSSARVGHVLDLAGSRDVSAGEVTFLGWTGDGRFAIFASSTGLLAVGSEGPAALSAAPVGPWDSRAEALLQLPAGLTEVAAAGKLFRQLPPGDYQFPVVSADGSAFLFERAGFLWSARITVAAASPNTDRTADDAGKLVNEFMTARLAQDPGAQNFLDQSGRAAYSGGGPALLSPPGLRFTRWFTVYGDQATHYVVRLVFSQDSREASYVDESLNLVRGQDGRLLVDRATATPGRTAGAGPEVIAVQQSGPEIQVSFDSDLDENGLARAVTLTDAAGKPAASQTTYRNRTVTLTLSSPGAGVPLKLAVQTALKDVSGRSPQAEFDLDLTG